MRIVVVESEHIRGKTMTVEDPAEKHYEGITWKDFHLFVD